MIHNDHQTVRHRLGRRSAPARTTRRHTAGPSQHTEAQLGDAYLRRVHPVVSAAVSTGTRRAYGSYWNRVNNKWGNRRIDEPTASEIKHLVTDIRANVVPRRNARGGRSAGE
ncbi:site-specific integrase, partial [Kibdelosporangium lantanae]